MARRYQLKRAPSAARYRIDYDQRLNDEQLAVVTAGSGKLLVIAGAGSGKTRTLTYRVARLIEGGVSPDRILLLTFTNRAAAEMTGRVQELIQLDARAVHGGTFHSIGRRILREHGDRIGYPTNFGIIDREDSESLLKQVIAELDVDTRRGRFPRPGTVLNVLSASVNTGESIGDVLVSRYPQFAEHEDAVADAALRYQARKVDFGVMDFDDLLVNWRRLMADDDELAERLSARYEHVLVDEYQDTNAIQAELVDRMSAVHGNLMVVGDDCQSIYSFRGADFRNILEFEQRHPSAKRFMLRRNYRSTPQILGLANRSIACNEEQFEKELVSEQTPGPLPAHVRCRDEAEQAAFVAQRILELRDEDVPLDRIAVLYRAHYQSMELQLELNRRGVPFLVRSGQRFFEQRHIKDVLAFLRFVENPRDQLAFQRIALLADGIGAKTANRVFAWIQAHGDLEGALSHPDARTVVGRRAQASWGALTNTLLGLTQPSRRNNASEALDWVREQLYEPYAQRAFDNFPNRLREIETLTTYATQHGTIRGFIDSLSLEGDATGLDLDPGSDDDEQVVLSTVHQAKGLEFQAVFVLWLAEDRFPLARASETREELEEERRLFYVATTRAQRELYLTSPMLAFDRREGTVVLRPSPFVREIAPDGDEGAVLERWDLVHG